MNFAKLEEQASVAINEIDQFVATNGGSDQIESIKQQMLFIRDNANRGKDPAIELGDERKFTYSIIASREFASPAELELKEYLDEVSRLLDEK